MMRRVAWLPVPSVATLGSFLLASSLHAQAPPPNPIEVVYSTNSSDDRILRLDFATGTSTVVNTDARQISRLSGLAVRNDGSAVHLLVCDSVGDAVLFYENAAGAGRPITTEIRFPDGVSLDLAGNAYVVTGNVRHEVWKLPRGGSRPGGYGAPVLIDQDLPSTLLEDTRVVPFSAGRLRQGDLLVLSRVPATIFRYPKVDCAPGDAACTGFGPREVFVPESAFPEGAKPTGLAFAPSRDLLVSRHVGEILRYGPDGSRVQPNFAAGLGEGRLKIAVGVQDGKSYAFVVNRSGGGGVERLLINDDGTGAPDGTVTDKVSNPNGVGLGSGQAAPTPQGENVVAMPASQATLTFDDVVRAGLTTARVIEFEDNRGGRNGGVFEVDQSLKEFFPEGSPLRSELPDVTVPAHVQAFRKGDPDAGTPTFLMTILDSSADLRRTVEVHYDEKDQLGYEPSCTDADATRQPRTFYAPETDPPKSDPPTVEGPVFTDVTTGCGSNIGRGSEFSLWLTARDTRDLSDVTESKLDNLAAALDFYPCIAPGTKGLLEAELQGAAAAFAAYEDTGAAAQQALAIAHLHAFIGVVDSDPGGFASCDASLNVGGALIVRAESARFTIAKVVVVPLTVVTQVINDNGGTAVASDFSLNVAGNRRSPARFGGDEDGRMVGLRPGAYSVSASEVFGYATSFSQGCFGSIDAGEPRSCTIIKDDIPPKLTLVKVVTNDNGGTAAAADFALSASGPTPITGAGGVTSDGSFHQGTYALGEAGPPGYAASPWSCTGGGTQAGNQIALRLSEVATCEITNDDVPPSLTLVKQVINDNGGTAAATDFTLTASGSTPTPISGAGGAVSDDTFWQGTYTLSETAGQPGYAASAWSCTGGTVVGGNRITLRLAETATCQITNDDVPPKLTLVKHVVNDNGGTAEATDFTLSATGPTPISGPGGVGSGATFSQGTYALSEAGPDGYSAGVWICAGGAQAGNVVTLAPGDIATCEITNDDVQPRLIVIKHVINDDGGSSVASDFTLRVTGSRPSPAAFPGDESGTMVGLAAGGYSVSETGPGGYRQSLSGDCTGTIAIGEVRTCTITNDDIPPAVLFGTDGQDGNLITLDRATGAGTIVGPMGAGAVPALAADPATGTLYAGRGAGMPLLYTIDPASGQASLLGDSGLGFGAIGGLDFGPDGTLYAAVNIAGDGGTGSDHLAIIDKVTGRATIVGAFGTCTGVLVPSTGGGSCTLEGMEAIAFRSDGVLFGALSPRGTGAPGLYRIDPATGSASFVAAILDESGSPPSGGVVSLQFADDGTLYGGTARAVSTATDGGRLIIIDPENGRFQFVGSVGATSGSSLAALALAGVGTHAAYHLQVLADSPIAYWRFEEIGATIAADSAGSNDGTYKDVVLGQPSAFPPLGNAAEFNGSSSFVSVPALGTVTDLTIEAWVNANTFPTNEWAAVYNTDVANPDSSHWQFVNGIFGLGTRFEWALGFSDPGNSTTFETNTWYHLVTTYEQSTGEAKLFVNGLFMETLSVIPGKITNLTVGNIGAWMRSLRFFNGRIDEVAIYRTALSRDRIQTHFDAAVGT